MNKILITSTLILLSSTFSYAQNTNKRPILTGDPVADTKNIINPPTVAGVKLTGNINADAKAILAKLDGIVLADLNYASKLAQKANTPASLVRKQCVDAIVVLKQQVDGQTLVDDKGVVIPPPDPGLITGVERLAETIDAISPTGPLFTNCAGAAQLVKTNTLTAINAIITGAASFSAITPIIP